MEKIIRHLIGITFSIALIFVYAAFTLAQNSSPTPSSDTSVQRRATGESKEEKRKRKAEEKEAQRQAGVKCIRLQKGSKK
jgi:mannitol-specific phosphotransferase system IIBC component